MLLRRLVVVGVVGFVSLAANFATAEDAAAPNRSSAVDGVSFVDPDAVFGDRFQLDVGPTAPTRFASTPSGGFRRFSSDSDRSVEVSLVARGAAGFDVAFAQRGGLGFSPDGDIERESRASELRLGRGLRDMPRDEPTASPRWYIFAASEDEALVWRPGARSDFGGAGNGFALQERVEVGDIQAGVTYEQLGLQASLAYVEREISVRSGARLISDREDFTGLTLTYRH